jgi:hypothetical protein
MARFANKSNSNFPFQKCVVSKGRATSTADHLFLRPATRGKQVGQTPTSKPLGGNERLRNRDAVDDVVAQRRLFAQQITDPLITVHRILDPWCKQYNYYNHLIS